MSDFYLDEDVSEHLAPPLRALGHDVTTTGLLANKGLKDPSQLLTAASLARIFVTYNADDFKVLQEAWHLWPPAWQVTPAPMHRGILIIHSGPRVTPADLALVIHRFIVATGPIDNRLFALTLHHGWREIR